MRLGSALFRPTCSRRLRVRRRDRCSCVGTPASAGVRGPGSVLPRLPPWWQMATSRQPSLSPSAGAGSRPPHAVRLHPLIVPLSLSCLCAENWLAQVLRCTSTHAAAPAHDEATQSSRGAALTTGASAADVSGSAPGRWCCGDRHGHRRYVSDTSGAPCHHHGHGGMAHGDQRRQP